MSNAVANGLAGAGGGIIAQIITYPLQTVNTRQQTERVSKQSFANSKRLGTLVQILQVIRSDGWGGLYSGLKPSLLGTAASQGIYYYFYQVFKNKAEAIAIARRAKGRGDGTIGMFSWLLVAAFAGSLNVLLTNPVWVLVTRMQTSLPFAPSQTCDGENGGYCQNAGGFRSDALSNLSPVCIQLQIYVPIYIPLQNYAPPFQISVPFPFSTVDQHNLDADANCTIDFFDAKPITSRVCRQWRILLESQEFYHHRKNIARNHKVACLVQALPRKLVASESDVPKSIEPSSFGITVFDPVSRSWDRLDPVPQYPNGMPWWWGLEDKAWNAGHCPRHCVGVVGENGRLVSWGELDSAVRVGTCGVMLQGGTLVVGSEYQGASQGFYMAEEMKGGQNGKSDMISVLDEFSGFVQSGCCAEI
ncbi:hypothetical protein EV1_022898 [Malus domestica]